MYDKRTMKDSKWVGIVVRQLPYGKDIKYDILSTFNDQLIKYSKVLKIQIPLIDQSNVSPIYEI